MQDFVHLHVHTQYSILDGQASIPRLVDKAIANGMRGMAVTDHGSMFGIKEFFNYVNKKNGGTNGDIKKLKKRKKNDGKKDFDVPGFLKERYQEIIADIKSVMIRLKKKVICEHFLFDMH